MAFWAIAAGMVLAALAVLARALARGPAAAEGEHPDMAVYRAQLAEVDRDSARGLIAPDEARGLRTEIARRILDLDRTGGRQPATAAGGLTLPLALITAALAGAVALYGHLGAPARADLPHAARIAAADRLRAERPSQAEAEASLTAAAPTADAGYAALMEQLRASTVKHPDRVEGFRLLVQHEANLGNYAAAARAKARVIDLEDPQGRVTALDHAELADLLIRAAGGTVTAEAEAELDLALKLDPTLGTARFYAGLLEAQTGRPDLAFAIWRPLYEESPPGAPWMGFLDERIAFVALAAGVDYAPPAKGPDAADVAAAAEMTAEERAQMIEGMVGGLEARLMADGGSAAEWVQLLQALAVLGQPDRAALAWARAEKTLASDAQALETVRAAAIAAGVTQ